LSKNNRTLSSQLACRSFKIPGTAIDNRSVLAKYSQVNAGLRANPVIVCFVSPENPSARIGDDDCR
jgi:hypothetical protein